MLLTVISSYEDTALFNNKSNKCVLGVLYLKLSRYVVDWRLAIHIQFTYSSDFHIRSVALTNSS